MGRKRQYYSCISYWRQRGYFESHWKEKRNIVQKEGEKKKKMEKETETERETERQEKEMERETERKRKRRRERERDKERQREREREIKRFSSCTRWRSPIYLLMSKYSWSRGTDQHSLGTIGEPIQLVKGYRSA